MNAELEDIGTRVNERVLAYHKFNEMYQLEEQQERKLIRKFKDIQIAQNLILDVAQVIQQKAHIKISKIVTDCLQAIFEEDHEFFVLFSQKAGRTTAKLVFRKNGMEIDPTTEEAGGVLDVVAFVLRVSCLVLLGDKVRPFLVLDEPFKNVSKKNGYLEKIPAMLEKLSKDSGIQILMITHIKELEIGKVIQI